MQASRPINLPIPTSNPKESRSFLLVGPDESFLGNGNTQIRISNQIFMSDIVQGTLNQLAASDNNPAAIQNKTGLLEIRSDYASSQKQLVFNIDGFTQAENPRKVQGKSECFHSCRYKIQSPDGSASTL